MGTRHRRTNTEAPTKQRSNAATCHKSCWCRVPATRTTAALTRCQWHGRGTVFTGRPTHAYLYHSTERDGVITPRCQYETVTDIDLLIPAASFFRYARHPGGWWAPVSFFPCFLVADAMLPWSGGCRQEHASASAAAHRLTNSAVECDTPLGLATGASHLGLHATSYSNVT